MRTPPTTLFSASSSAETQNCDGRINLKDVSNILRRSAGWQVETDTGAADYNADGEVNLRDARAIILLLA